MPNKEFKTVVVRKLSELPGNTERQFNKIRRKIHEQNEKFNREIEIIKKEPNRNPGADEYNE